MTIEEAQEKILDLQKEINEIKNEKTTLESDYNTYKETKEKEYSILKDKNEKLIEHNNNLFRQVVQPISESKEKEKEETKEESLDNLLDKLQ